MNANVATATAIAPISGAHIDFTVSPPEKGGLTQTQSTLSVGAALADGPTRLSYATVCLAERRRRTRSKPPPSMATPATAEIHMIGELSASPVRGRPAGAGDAA